MDAQVTRVERQGQARERSFCADTQDYNARKLQDSSSREASHLYLLLRRTIQYARPACTWHLPSSALFRLTSAHNGPGIPLWQIGRDMSLCAIYPMVLGC